MTKVFYDQEAILELSDRVSYEAWLLEAIYNLLEEELFPTFPDGVIYALGSSNPQFIAHSRSNIVIGDWRPGFLEAGAPLVFTSTFKLLDMFLEWVLERNGHASTHRFAEKIKTLKGTLTYPPVVENRPWLQERLRCLYEAFEPLRGTIIHSRHFASVDGSLRVSSSKGGNVGLELQINAPALRTFAMLCVSVLRYVEGTWSLDPHKENLLRWQLDQLAHLHLMPALGQKEPYRTTVRVFLEGEDPRSVDVAKVRKDLERQYPQHSSVFDLRALQVRGETVIAAYLFPFAVLDEVGNLADASQYCMELPQDLDPQHYSTSSEA
ncbi:hypothetical protein AZOA_46200 [Azoarcus sp. Aa7]|nr:hypothetical protein [Azoarcus sp. Aa7]